MSIFCLAVFYYFLAEKPRMDVGLILGFTTETTSKELDDQITISSNILDTLRQKTTDLKAGVITYSVRAVIRQSLAFSDLQNVLQSINLRSGSRTLSEALQLASEEFFLTSNGGRSNAVKSLIVFVTEPTDVRAVKMVETLRAQGINIVSIGVGENVDQSEVDKVAGKDKTGIIMNDDNKNQDILDKVSQDAFTGNIH